ncbi:MAG TPA: response regulator [Nitrososphaeraceae archaeon]|nr:response regulator [Nitrososphaeraceae archaeon]
MTTSNSNQIILLLDDEQDILTLFRDSLESWGYQTIAFDNPINALKYMTTENNISKCSLVITDYRMPQMNGIDFIKKIREKSDTTLKIMLISAFLKSGFTLQENLDTLKINKIMEKPLSLPLLKEEVQKLLK